MVHAEEFSFLLLITFGKDPDYLISKISHGTLIGEMKQVHKTTVGRRHHYVLNSLSLSLSRSLASTLRKAYNH